MEIVLSSPPNVENFVYWMEQCRSFCWPSKKKWQNPPVSDTIGRRCPLTTASRPLVRRGGGIGPSTPYTSIPLVKLWNMCETYTSEECRRHTECSFLDGQCHPNTCQTLSERECANHPYCHFNEQCGFCATNCLRNTDCQLSNKCVKQTFCKWSPTYSCGVPIVPTHESTLAPSTSQPTTRPADTTLSPTVARRHPTGAVEEWKQPSPPVEPLHTTDTPSTSPSTSAPLAVDGKRRAVDASRTPSSSDRLDSVDTLFSIQSSSPSFQPRSGVPLGSRPPATPKAAADQSLPILVSAASLAVVLLLAIVLGVVWWRRARKASKAPAPALDQPDRAWPMDEAHVRRPYAHTYPVAQPVLAELRSKLSSMGPGPTVASTV